MTGPAGGRPGSGGSTSPRRACRTGLPRCTPAPGLQRASGSHPHALPLSRSPACPPARGCARRRDRPGTFSPPAFRPTPATAHARAAPRPAPTLPPRSTSASWPSPATWATRRHGPSDRSGVPAAGADCTSTRPSGSAERSLRLGGVLICLFFACLLSVGFVAVRGRIEVPFRTRLSAYVPQEEPKCTNMLCLADSITKAALDYQCPLPFEYSGDHSPILRGVGNIIRKVIGCRQIGIHNQSVDRLRSETSTFGIWVPMRQIRWVNIVDIFRFDMFHNSKSWLSANIHNMDRNFHRHAVLQGRNECRVRRRKPSTISSQRSRYTGVQRFFALCLARLQRLPILCKCLGQFRTIFAQRFVEGIPVVEKDVFIVRDHLFLMAFYQVGRSDDSVGLGPPFVHFVKLVFQNKVRSNSNQHQHQGKECHPIGSDSGNPRRPIGGSLLFVLGCALMHLSFYIADRP